MMCWWSIAKRIGYVCITLFYFPQTKQESDRMDRDDPTKRMCTRSTSTKPRKRSTHPSLSFLQRQVWIVLAMPLRGSTLVRQPARRFGRFYVLALVQGNLLCLLVCTRLEPVQRVAVRTFSCIFNWSSLTSPPIRDTDCLHFSRLHLFFRLHLFSGFLRF